MTCPELVRTSPCDGVGDLLALGFARACTELAEARRRRSRKDTPAHRAAVAEWRARIDDVLDLYLEFGRGGR